MNRILREKLVEALKSVLPVTLIVMLLSVTIAPLPIGMLALFIAGAVLLVIGMALFSLGADMAMMPMGEQMGAHLSNSRKLWLMALVCLAMGMLITIAEPDLQVLAEQVPHIPNIVIIGCVAAGVGVFLVIALLRIVFNIKLSRMLMAFYAIVFTIAIFTSENYLAIAFDSSGVTTGPITVPFIMALGIGLSAVRGGQKSQEDSFGLVALASIGPIIAVMIMGMFYPNTSGVYTPTAIPEVDTSRNLAALFISEAPSYMKEVAIALLPIVALFGIFQAVSLRLPFKRMAKMCVGLLYTYLGLVLFLTGVNVGFMPAGNLIGVEMAALSYNWIIIPVGMLIGFFIVQAEPSVHVLNKQVEDITDGRISQKAMMRCLSWGTAVSIGLAMVRVTTGISIWWCVAPGYILALGLSFFVSPVFTAIAFDSGGVASGPMTATFLLPFAMGACEQIGGNVLTDAFGIVAMVAMTPLIAVQIMGLVYKRRAAIAATEAVVAFDEDLDIIEL